VFKAAVEAAGSLALPLVRLAGNAAAFVTDEPLPEEAVEEPRPVDKV
jgi:hypothetical protein